jgi:ABC-type polysaccharide/polyol phosphate transport system ATPase subunit
MIRRPKRNRYIEHNLIALRTQPRGAVRYDALTGAACPVYCRREESRMAGTEQPIIEVQGVSRQFILHKQRPQTLHELLIRTLNNDRGEREIFWALRDIDFTLYAGESLGIVGRNGSGKSTLLKLIAGLLAPTHGTVRVYGSVAALLEIGAGFHPDLSGRENIYLNGAFLGLSQAQIRRLVPEIVAYSELEAFIDVPVKHYSSGMYMRLAFSIAVHVDPDILITDEVFAVGDDAFRAKCEQTITDFRRRGKTMLVVSHAMPQIVGLCDRAIWLNQGTIVAAGSSDDVSRQYRAALLGNVEDVRVGIPILSQST